MAINTGEYRDAVNHDQCPGCRGAFSGPDHTQPMRDWHDKPHRLVYDLCNEVDRLWNRVEKLEDSEQSWVDRSVYYRNIAINAGATPEKFDNEYDRALARDEPNGRPVVPIPLDDNEE